MRWVDMPKGVAYLFRYREFSLAANGRYPKALAQVDDPTDAMRTLDRITTRKKLALDVRVVDLKLADDLDSIFYRHEDVGDDEIDSLLAQDPRTGLGLRLWVAHDLHRRRLSQVDSSRNSPGQ
jgi:hypothetical protein